MPVTAGQVAYRSAHVRIFRQRGSASEYPCVDCGVAAREWSYDHCDAQECRDESGRHYSLDPSHYQPRCRLCHIAFDKSHKRACAEPYRQQVKDAVIHRNKARKHRDWDAENFWDDELEHLMEALQAL